jgi:hypothetical protein
MNEWMNELYLEMYWLLQQNSTPVLLYSQTDKFKN